MSLSFEVFPPKKETSYESVRIATEEIAALKPSFMSVTYGAGGGTSEYTLAVAKNLKEKLSVPMLAHLTCVSSDKATIKKRIEDLKANGITNVHVYSMNKPDIARGIHSNLSDILGKSFQE